MFVLRRKYISAESTSCPCTCSTLISPSNMHRAVQKMLHLQRGHEGENWNVSRSRVGCMNSGPAGADDAAQGTKIKSRSDYLCIIKVKSVTAHNRFVSWNLQACKIVVWKGGVVFLWFVEVYSHITTCFIVAVIMRNRTIYLNYYIKMLVTYFSV